MHVDIGASLSRYDKLGIEMARVASLTHSARGKSVILLERSYYFSFLNSRLYEAIDCAGF